ncbi:HlyU family transcriptional regulator [Amphritea sp. 1_MG-2023]|uniref:HlyU family transcriptional regulator n=1 Tax=Amphritea sp. 1_MG-2023 TaxID=3062670 RepID=UPI0026E47B7F|nr:HlyU family transcriptional regulator [Amphritea sp. 1_MG-2023]MDO6562257.1 HlyU family transcriptional regulator [Amphritea sp. 1_MG-2023]
MSLFTSIKSLFAPAESATKEPEALPSVDYQGFTISPVPIHEDGGYRINGVISKGEQSHRFIRADMLPSSDSCAAEMIRKAKQMIDQQGDGIF